MARIGASQNMWRSGTKFVAVMTLIWCVALSALGDARSEFLIRMLSTSSQFRVRAQAALALGSQAGDHSIVRALSLALRDEHPAVRAASAAALERLGDASAVPALKGIQNDRDGSVRTAVRSALAALDKSAEPRAAVAATEPTTEPTQPTGEATYYVGIAVPGGSAAGLSADTLRSLREHVAGQVAQVAGVKLAPENEASAAATRVIASQKLVGYWIDSSVTSLEVKPDGGLRAQVSVIVGTYPGRDMRAMLSGAATLMGGGSGESAKRQAIEAAFASALRRLPQAMQAGLARAP